MLQVRSLICTVFLASTASLALPVDVDVTDVALEELINNYRTLNDRISHLEAVNEEREREIEDLKTCRCDGRDDSGILRERRSAVGPDKVAFYAAVRKYAIPNITPYRPIPFDQVFANDGNAYDPVFGMFVAPVNGTYLISATVAAELTGTNITRVFSFINARGFNVARIVCYNRQQGSQTVVLDLEAGDAVYVANGNRIYTILGSLYTTFSGVLLNST